ncbi:MAG: histidinol-phosphate transaminase [Bacteroidia bacterium]|nr:histidinol-phosphate transaminase [Bacteroidia bacterium]
MKINSPVSFRPDLNNWTPYSSARSLAKNNKNYIFLDANESPFGIWNRYPDPYQSELKKEISKIKKISPKNILLGNGSDEVLDLCMRLFAEPKKDKILICPPTYGMYEVLARLNMLRVLKVPLRTPDFQLDVDNIIRSIEKQRPKMMIFCSPNNPTGNTLTDIKKVLDQYDGVVLVDEAYIDFCKEKSLLSYIVRHPNLIVIQTLSKAWGLAGARIGMAFANERIISMLTAIKPPYNIGSPSIKAATKALRTSRKNFYQYVNTIIKEKNRLEEFLTGFPPVKKIYPSEANFILVESAVASEWQNHLKKHRVIVRDRSSQIPDAFRVSIGTVKENNLFIKYSKEFYKILQKKNFYEKSALY